MRDSRWEEASEQRIHVGCTHTWMAPPMRKLRGREGNRGFSLGAALTTLVPFLATTFLPAAAFPDCTQQPEGRGGSAHKREGGK